MSVPDWGMVDDWTGGMQTGACSEEVGPATDSASLRSSRPRSKENLPVDWSRTKYLRTNSEYALNAARQRGFQPRKSIYRAASWDFWTDPLKYLKLVIIEERRPCFVYRYPVIFISNITGSRLELRASNPFPRNWSSSASVSYCSLYIKGHSPEVVH